MTAKRPYRYYDLLMATFVACLLMSDVAAVKPFRLGPLTLPGGVLVFPISYILGDVLTEVYGYARSRRVIWAGFAASIGMSALFAAVGALPPAPGWPGQEAYVRILGQTPRIVLGSLVGYFAGEFANSYVLAKMKILTRGRWLWTRTIGSTIVGEGIDTALFISVAFGGVWPWALVFRVILSHYLVKVGYEVLATPATYWVVAQLKRREQEDYYDWDTDFSPFHLV